MIRWLKVLGPATMLVLLTPVTALAQKTTSNPYLWWTVCGGNSFATCAAVDVEFTSGTINGSTVANGTVTLRVWNLSGLPTSGYLGTVFTAIGFDNTGSLVGSNLAMAGGLNNVGTPAQWELDSNQSVGGGVKLELVTTTPNGVGDGIASECGTAQLPGGNNEFWVNPCETDPNNLQHLSWNSNTGWVVFTFNFSGTWNLATTELLVKGQNGPNGLSTECLTGTNCGDIQIQCRNGNCTTTPEPITMMLLGTGLAGVGAAARRRRRREGITD